MSLAVATESTTFGALSTIYTIVTDTSGPKLCKFAIDTTWLPGGTVLNLSIQTTPNATTQYTEEKNRTLSNAVTLYQSNTTGSMTSGSNVLTLGSAFTTELVEVSAYEVTVPPSSLLLFQQTPPISKL